jgi:hypothetical protein
MLEHKAIKGIGTVILAFIFVALSAFIYSKVSYVSTPTTLPSNGVVCPKDSQSYVQTKAKKNIILLSNEQSYGKAQGDFIKQYNVTIERSGLNSQIACGYLFYSLSVKSKPIHSYENLYMTPSLGKQFGGHIYPNGDNLISSDVTATSTEMLFPLNEISYDGNERQNLEQADWASLLDVTNKIDFTIALNTTDSTGQINSVEIAYKCWNPQTGQETDDCNLQVTNVIPL